VSEFVNVRAPRGAGGDGWKQGRDGLAGACIVLPTCFFYPLANTEGIDVNDHAAVFQRQLRLRGGGGREGGEGGAAGGEEEGGGVIGEAAGGEALLGDRRGVVPARALAIYAAHLWARSWCSPGPSPASAGQEGDGQQGHGEAGGGEEDAAASALGGGGLEGQEGTSALGGGGLEGQEGTSKGSFVKGGGERGFSGGVSLSNQDGKPFSNNDILWLANLALRNKK
jgi:hypothetical protein